MYRTQLYWIYIQNTNTSHHFKDIKKDLVGDYITRDDNFQQDANSALQTLVINLGFKAVKSYVNKDSYK